MKSSNFAALMKKRKGGKQPAGGTLPSLKLDKPFGKKKSAAGRGSSDIALLKRKKMPA